MQHTTKWITGTWTRDFLLTAVLFGWLYQLLSPLGQAGGVPDMNGFYLFVGMLLLFDLLIPLHSVKIALKLASLFSIMYYFYYSGDKIWHPDWIIDVLLAALNAVSLAAEKRFMEIPDISQTFLFLLFLWLTASVYRNAMQSRIWLFILLFVGEVVIGVIDTFFPPDASGYVVRYFLLGFVLLSLSQLPELEKWARIPARLRGWPVKWVLWTLVITLTAVGTGIAAPKYPPAWPDPVAFLQGKAAGEMANGPKKIGYGSDDSALGGPYVTDDTVAFTVITNEPGYYRGESKVHYTGRGWSMAGSNFTLAENVQQKIALEKYAQWYGILPSIKTKTVEQQIEVQNGVYDAIFGQYQPMNVQENSTPSAAERFSLRYFQPQGWKWGGQLTKGNAYKVVSQVPYYDPEGVKKREQQMQKNDPMDSKLRAMFLELPSSLPPRIRELAFQIANGKATDYEKAKAIEEYLRYNYKYEVEQVPFPGPNQDFVDQFLFESKQGYCDHFSSSMVVLARAAGLPARWVKGFTEGESDSSFDSSNDKKKYIVRNRNAHSWAEVYIPGTGWLPFEPTASFSQPVVMEVLPVDTPNTETEQKEQNQRNNTPKEEDNSVDVSYEIDWERIGKIFLLVLGTVLAVGWIFRRRIMVVFYLRRSLGRGPDHSSIIVLAIERLLKALQRLGWQREPDATFREFGDELALKGYKGSEWISLTRIFERIRYGNKQAKTREVGEFRQLWGRIVRKIGRTKKR
ncbi:DUF4129 domain-containing transglutaminase family protein [Effusibacillus consociatus]|uniref:DUF4129 domain-containing transglutaminase family protein n=1 Tax=Effusibacillus consociatus TaxID=1117041 RepID=A0ABV9PYM4_9BACL